MTKKTFGGIVFAVALLAAVFAWFLRVSHTDDKQASKPDTQIIVTDAKPASKAKTKIITNSIGMKLVLIPAGKFTMGSTELEKGREGEGNPQGSSSEGPEHEVEITMPFYPGIHEVTVAQFRAFVNDSGYKTEGGAEAGAYLDEPRFSSDGVSPGGAGELERRQGVLRLAEP